MFISNMGSPRPHVNGSRILCMQMSFELVRRPDNAMVWIFLEGKHVGQRPCSLKVGLILSLFEFEYWDDLCVRQWDFIH